MLHSGDFHIRKLKMHSKDCEMKFRSWNLRSKLNEAYALPHASSNHNLFEFSVVQPCERLCRLKSRKRERELTPSTKMALLDFDAENLSICFSLRLLFGAAFSQGLPSTLFHRTNMWKIHYQPNRLVHINKTIRIHIHIFMIA